MSRLLLILILTVNNGDRDTFSDGICDDDGDADDDFHIHAVNVMIVILLHYLVY